MKTFVFSLSVLSALALWAEPTVSNVRVEQLDDATVKVTYTLDADAVVTLDACTNETVSIGLANVTRVWGEANRLVKGAGDHVLYWAPEKSWGVQPIVAGDVRVVVKAWATDAPPDYMVVDLVVGKRVSYYESVEQLPDGGITSRVYKTDRIVMRKIPAKDVKWRIGSPSGEVGKVTDSWDAQEVPHHVTLRSDYYLGVYEFTEKQCNKWGRGTDYKEADADKPVTGVSVREMRGNESTGPYNWPTNGHDVDPKSILGLLRDKTGVDFDLPTEAQWEFACRAGVSSALYNGQNLTSKDGVNNQLDDIAWYDKNSDNSRHAVGQLKPNGFGLYDMLGNEGEFCLDWVVNNLGSGEVEDPVGPDSGSYKPLRGGAYDKAAYFSRAAFRQNWVSESNQYVDCGHRLWAPAVAK